MKFRRGCTGGAAKTITSLLARAAVAHEHAASRITVGCYSLCHTEIECESYAHVITSEDDALRWLN